MNVTCPDCTSVFRVDPAKVPESGVRARCSVCGGVIAVAHVAAVATHPTAAATLSPATGFEAAFASVLSVAPTSEEAVHVPAAPMPGSAHMATAVEDATFMTPAASPELAMPAAEERAVQSRPGRPFNPYLSNTPELRARRLARALVSDLVAYNPQKREEGLRDGTLRQLFREEIRKSWEEYVEQVGAQVAESTPHFQDALNDVLAGGRRVF